MSKNNRAVAYGLGAPTIDLAPVPIVESRAPTTSDGGYDIGQTWIDTATNTAYVLTSYTAGTATWEFNGAPGVLNTLTDGSGGAISPSSGNITLAGTSNQITTTGSGNTITWSLPSAITAPGSLTTTTTLTGGTGITATTGNIVASTGALTATLGAVSAGTTVTGGTGVTATTGNVTATAGKVIAGTIVQAQGDAAGTVSTVSLSNVVSGVSTGVGSLVMNSATVGPTANSGWLKIYNGASAVYIPFWTTNAP